MAGHVTQACGSPVPAMSNLNNSNNMPTSPTGSDDMRYHGTELVMLYDYKVRLSTPTKVSYSSDSHFEILST